MNLLDNVLRVVSDDIVEGGVKAAKKSLPKTARKLKNGIELGAEEIPTLGKNLNMVSPEQNLGGRMLNERGNPVTFYHSTPNEFTRFDDAKLGENTGYDNTKLGHFVTTDKDFSKRFIDIDGTGKTGRTMELQARVQNPITHPYMAGSKYGEEELDKIVEDYLLATDNQDGLNMLREYADESGNNLYDEYMDLTMGGESPFENAAEERNLLRNKGYDAVEIVEGPRSGVVEGATENTPVSSYAVLRGDDLRPVSHIPVGQENYASLRQQNVPVNINNLVPEKEVDFSHIDDELFKNYGTDSDKELYARVMKGGVLDPEEIANSQFVKNLSAAAEEAEKKYGSEIITKEMANNPSTIPEEAMNRMSDLASSTVKEAKSIPGVGYENKAVIFMGGPSSGKSSAGMKYFDAKEGKGGNFFVLDSDDLKPKFKEFGKGEGAGITHEASAFTAESLIKPDLMAEGMNLAIPIVGKSQKSLYKQIQSLTDNGYDVSVVKVDLPVEKAASRNFARMLESGRNVPDNYVREAVEDKPAAVYEQMVEDLKSGKLKGVSGVARIDNDVRRGRLPIAKEYSEGTQIADLMKKLKYVI